VRRTAGDRRHIVRQFVQGVSDGGTRRQVDGAPPFAQQVDVVGVGPTPGSQVDRDRVPATVSVVTATRNTNQDGELVAVGTNTLCTHRTPEQVEAEEGERPL